ncbi:MAG: exodeoxyribonuclease I [Rubrivivax sp.]
MEALTFFWHDYETFGRDPRRDRPAQFAGVRTDAELNEIGAPVMSYCQPAPDFLPDPESCLITGILPQRCLADGVPEHRFAALIEAELGQPGTIGVGYNSIRFDDEVTRHLFWRNLIDPYAREWSQGCSRWDLLDVVRAAWALRPDGLVWPEADGGVSFRLERLAKANGLLHEAAHDALSDVRATIALARKLRDAQPRLWDFCLKLRHKAAVWDEIGQRRPFVHLSGMYPTARGCLAVVWPLAMHPSNRNELIVWDLAHDPAELPTLTREEARLRLFTPSAELPEGVTRLPVKTIHANKSPIVFGNLRALGPAAARWQIDLEQAQRHAETAAALGGSLDGLWQEVYARPDDAPGGRVRDVDEDLYGGFVGNADRALLQRLRRLGPDELAARQPAFDDARLDELLFRYRARNFFGSLSDTERALWQAHCAERLHGGTGDRPGLAAWLDHIDTLAESADERGQNVLAALVDYAETIAPEPPR